MSRNTSQKDTSSLGEDIPPTEQVDTTRDDIAIGTPKQPRKKRTEAEKLQTDTLAALNLDTNILHSGSRLLRSQKTLLDTEEEEKIRKQFEHDRLIDQEITYRPLRAGQTTQEKYLPTRQDFEYIYKHIEDLDCQVWASELEPWLHFVKRHNLHADPSIPVLDKDGLEYPDAIFSLETLLQLPTNKKYLKKRRKPYVSIHKAGLSSEDKDLPDHNSGDSGASSGSSGSFVIISSQTTRKLITPDPSLLDDPPSLGATPTTTPITTPPPSPTPPSSPTPTPSPNPSPTPSDPDMATLKERSVFFPSEKYDGRNKNLTKQHWQTFEDFCDQQKLYITDRGVDKPAATIEQISPFFKMTLTDLARAWMERQTFTTANDLKEKFLTDFSPYGKTHRQWIARWAELKFNPDLDNIDEFLEKFEDLARLNNLGDDYKLHAFKIAMPKEIELHLRGVDNLQQCYQTAKDLLTIVQNPVTNKMSTLSLAQSRSPSPTLPRTRSPSPRSNRQPTNSTDRSRPRTRQNFDGFKQYPGQNRPQSIMKRQSRPFNGRGRGRSINRNRFQNRSRSFSRNRSYPDRCYNCNMIGHYARNCFTRTRTQSQNRNNFPRRFTPNIRKNQRRGNQRTQQPRVRFQDENNNRYTQNRYQNDYEPRQRDYALEARIRDYARERNRIDPTGKYTEVCPPNFELDPHQGQEHQDEYQTQYQDQYQDDYRGYPLN